MKDSHLTIKINDKGQCTIKCGIGDKCSPKDFGLVLHALTRGKLSTVIIDAIKMYGEETDNQELVNIVLNTWASPFEKSGDEPIILPSDVLSGVSGV